MPEATFQIAHYIAVLYEGRIIAYGTPEEIKQAASAYRVYFAKADGGADNGDYLMDHSTFTYLMFPENQLGALFKRDDTAETIAEQTACLIKSR